MHGIGLGPDDLGRRRLGEEVRFLFGIGNECQGVVELVEEEGRVVSFPKIRLGGVLGVEQFHQRRGTLQIARLVISLLRLLLFLLLLAVAPVDASLR